MKKLVTTFFSGDTVSAAFALLVFLLVLAMITSHLFFGLLSVGTFFLELLVGFASFGLVWAVYSENKQDKELKDKSK